MTQLEQRRVEFFYFDAGGGHRSAALAISEVLAERFPHWQIELINLQNLLDQIDPVSRLTRFQSHEVYNGYIKSGLTYGSGPFLRALQTGIKLLSTPIENQLARYWRSRRPDLVVSVIPNFNGPIFRALRRVHAGVPYVTVMTDLADYPPHFWLEDQDQFFVCGTDMAARQAMARGVLPSRIIRTSGMVLKPHFYRAPPGDRRAARAAIGLDPDLPTSLIMFGGYGSKVAVRILDRLEASSLPLQHIVLCGHNEKLRKKLQSRPRCHAAGFIDNVPEYMRMADFFIGKPGPGSISEALHMGLPVIVERNRRTLLQERYNTMWIEQQELGVVVPSFARIAKAVAFLLTGDRLELYRANARRLNNRAVYEISDMLAVIIDTPRETAVAA